MATSAAGKDNGMIGQLKDQMGGLLDKILSLPDKPKTEAGRKAAYIAADIAVIALGIIALGAMTQGFSHSALADPGIMTMMSIPMTLGISGMGLAWLISDLVGKENRRTAAKVMAILMPMMLLAGTLCIMGASFHSGIYPSSFNSHFVVGIILLPVAVVCIGQVASVLKDKNGQFIHRRALRETHLPGHAPGLIPPPSGMREHDVEMDTFGSSSDTDKESVAQMHY